VFILWESCGFLRHFWYFWLTIQNTANRHVSNAFDLIAVFISFSVASQTVRHGREA
jgi:hypothetical protein